jgi:hypothetical protein
MARKKSSKAGAKTSSKARAKKPQLRDLAPGAPGQVKGSHNYKAASAVASYTDASRIIKRDIVQRGF